MLDAANITTPMLIHNLKSSLWCTIHLEQYGKLLVAAVRRHSLVPIHRKAGGTSLEKDL